MRIDTDTFIVTRRVPDYGIKRVRDLWHIFLEFNLRRFGALHVMPLVTSDGVMGIGSGGHLAAGLRDRCGGMGHELIVC